MIAPRPTVRTFVELGYLKAHPQKATSLQQIYLAIDMVERWAAQDVFCDQLDREFLLSFRDWRLKERPLPVCPRHCYPLRRSNPPTRYRCPQRDCPERATYVAAVKAATANKEVRTLVALWSEAVDQGFNGAVKKRIRRLAEELDNLPCWEPGDLSKMLAAAKLEPNECLFPCSAADFWQALILVCYDTGSRISAVLQATPADLDLRTGTLTLRAKTTKGKKCAVHGLSEQTLGALLAIHDPQSAYLLPCVCKLGALRKRLKRILARAGLPHTRIHLFHKLRRTTATQIVIQTGSLEAAREHLGHSSVEVTKRYVDRTRLEETQRNARLLPRPTL